MQYEELKKAVENGKTIQFLKTKVCNYECDPHWVDWNSYGFCFQEGVEYRIKPDDIEIKQPQNI